MINFKQLIDFRYLFYPYPSGNFKYLIPLSIFFLLLFISAWIFLILSKRISKKHPKKKFFQKIKDMAFTISIGGFFLLFFRYEEIAFLSIRFLLLVWLLLFIGWVGKLIFYYFKTYPKELEEFKIKLQKEKYLKRRK